MAIDLMALVAGRGIGAMTDIAVGRPESGGVPLVEWAVESVLESLVTGRALAERFTQRTSGDTGDMAALAIGNECGVEIMPLGADAVLEIVTIHLMTLITRRSLRPVAGGAVVRAESGGMTLVKFTVESPLEPLVARGAVAERLA